MNDNATNPIAPEDALAACAACKLPIAKRICFNPRGTGPKGCPTINAAAVLAQANQHYRDPAVGEFARQASRQEAEGYANRHERPYIMQPAKTRIVEICEFARKMDYQRLGLAFCMGLMREAAMVGDILTAQGFEVVSVGCKAGRTPKETIGITDDEKVFQDKPEAMCNPIFQARLLNDQASHFNILLGLCVGHDALFFQYATAPTTVLAVKDRVTGHNPLAAVYCSNSYYRRLKQP
ncbi:DUF1847 domain-containing protein [Desulfatitalea alkaliphila]|uniref:DUF1847 domain-containing protein n=1 Tax=Desulfatitalea alkaliphila TaxID=2929485 RepID=A0AA41R367_9BACT|nr:DUF1847 domain-containing protein [Desulfatitalea alkaliphila]MCJ8502262.1 DUF1847 domain-containing protein [Desulfatitalea alkaliphila]